MSTTTTTTDNPPDTLTTTTSPSSSIPFPALLETPITMLNTHILPEQRRSAILSAIQSHPLLASFLACQLFCSAVPITLFLIGVAVTASVAASIFACLAFLVLGPVLVFTTLLGGWIWGVGWIVVFVGGWVFEALDGRVNQGAIVEVKREEEKNTAREGKEKDEGLVVEEKEVSE